MFETPCGAIFIRIYWFGGQHQYTLENERLEPQTWEVGKTTPFRFNWVDFLVPCQLSGVYCLPVFTSLFAAMPELLYNHTCIILATALPLPKIRVVILQVLSLWMVNFCEGETSTKPNQIPQLIDKGPTTSFWQDNTVLFFDTWRKP